MAALEIIVGSSNPHKIAEISQICRALPQVKIVSFTDREPLPDIDEDGKTFAENAAKKAQLLAQYLYAKRGASASGMHTAVDGDTDTDALDKLAAARAKKSAEELLGLNKSTSAQASRRRSVRGDNPRLRRSDVLVLSDDSGIVVDALGGKPGVHSARYAGVQCDDDANNAKLLKELVGVEEEKRSARFVCALALASQKGVLLRVEGKVEGTIATELKGTKGFGYDPLFYYPPYRKTFGEVTPDMKNAVSHRANALRDFQVELAYLLKENGIA